jgi:hypothetical protein
MATRPDADLVAPLTREESLALVDEQARKHLGISGAEFIRKWDAGEFDDPDDKPHVMWIASLLPDCR